MREQGDHRCERNRMEELDGVILHPVIRSLARRAIRWFYRDAEILNAQAIPSEGATLIVASHGNDLTDILMTFLLSKRDILFVANMAAADSPIVRGTYAGLGVIPVARVRDARALQARGEDAGAINANAFVRVVDALKAGHAVAIFPEGNVNDAPHLGLLRNGAAKMALMAVEQGVDLTMVPVGYQYESPTTPRSGMLAIVVEPIRVAAWKPLNATKAVTEFTKFMRHELQCVTRNARTHKDAEQFANLVAIAGALKSTNSRSPIAAAHEAQLLLARHSASDGVFVANAIAPASMDKQSLLLEFETMATSLSNMCASFGGRRWSARDCADVLAASGDQSSTGSAPNVLLLLLGGPLALLALIWHAFPVWASHKLAIRFAPIRVEIAARTIVPGLYIIWLWYLALPALLLMSGVNRWLVLAVFVVQPHAGDFALAWRDWWRTWRLMQRVRSASESVKADIRMRAVAARSALRALR